MYNCHYRKYVDKRYKKHRGTLNTCLALRDYYNQVEKLHENKTWWIDTLHMCHQYQNTNSKKEQRIQSIGHVH